MPDPLMTAFLSGLATGLGAFAVFVAGRIGTLLIAALLGLSAGIGFTIVFFDLMPEAVRSGSWTLAFSGLGIGFLIGKLADLLFPHLSVTGSRRAIRRTVGGTRRSLLKTGYLFALGVAMHNLPEGMSLGAGLEAGEELGLLLAIAIGLHNFPEGMALCGVLILAGLARWMALTMVTGVGLTLPLGTVLSGAWMSAAPGMLSFILALGAGTMLYIVLCELIPQSCRMHPILAKGSIAAGAIISLSFSLII